VHPSVLPNSIFMTSYRFLTLLLGVALLTACSTNYKLIEIEVLKPAKYSVPPEIASIVLVNNSYPFRDTSVHVAMVEGNYMVFDSVLVDAFPDTLLKSLSKELLIRKFFDTVYIDTIKYNPEFTGKPLKPLSSGQVDEICDKHNAQAVLAVGGYSHGTNLKVDEVGYAEYYSTMDVSGVTYWRFYDAIQDQVIHEKIQADTLYWDGIGGTAQNSLVKFPSLKEATLNLADYMGWKFTDNIAPYWEIVQRKLFTSGNAYFMSASDWIANKNWEEAEKLWGFVYENGKPIDQARAAHNIAFSFEQKGDFESAAKWAYNSYQAYVLTNSMRYGEEIREATAYYKDMSVRKREYRKLVKQIGGVVE